MRDDLVFPQLSGLARVAFFDGLNFDNQPMVRIDNERFAARSLVDVANLTVGTELAVTDLAGETSQLLILGALVNPRVAKVDDKIELIGETEVVLRCGPASIRLTPDGRVTIRGTRVLSRSDGANRVQGASVELN
ncbi:hypothetical protein MWU60_16150 [Yoonia sp. F2084L]|nr:hypothetical protein [Yoonia sp. F2084L]